ncbi:IS4 family transposase [Singulisphaera acidiphila]|uniref:Transposase family protein n=2 Tax=Singulisphaera acidiphila TaxID=466153 RepID=L0DFL4_SINAD|nr:IS4 family transposase [Singulisphaera acidiphila]AGA27608.1 transposase family protein [Singulisphaera acidiphila DSM 18658]
MPPRIIPILARLRQDLAAVLSRETIEEACRQSNHSWRRRLLDPAATVYLFLLQVLHGNTACQHVVHFGNWSFTDSAYCQARKRLPLAVFHSLLEKIAATSRAATEGGSRWLEHRVWLVDGSSFSMPDAPELQGHFGQPGNQRKGCGFPVAKWLALFDLTTGMLLRSAAAPLRSHEMSRAAAISQELEPGDLVLGDRGFCSYAHLALLAGRELHGVFRIHQKQIVDFTSGRPGTRGGSKDVPGLPRSRWVLAHGDSDQVVVWFKPKKGPSWMPREEYEALPDEITVRELRYRVEVPGYRVREITLVTTLHDAVAYPAEALAELYFRRWQVEINIRHLKISMQMDVLCCETVDGVLKELAVFTLAYNLVRSVMGESARLQGVDPDRIGLVDAVRWLIGTEEGDLSVLVVNPSRRGRVEPRVKKRRAKQYMLMKNPRSELRKSLPKKHF